MLVTIQNDDEVTKQIVVALLPASSEADGTTEQTVHDVAAGDTLAVPVAEGRYVRLVELPASE